MKLTQGYKDKNNASGNRLSLRQSMLTFVNRYAETFEALTRTGYPFGGSLRPVNQLSASRNAAGKVKKEIASVQQQVGELSRTVAQLSDQVDQLSAQPSIRASHNPAGVTGRKQKSQEREIGINRFRALEGKA